MDRRARSAPRAGGGPLLIALLVLLAVGLTTGWGWLVALTAIGAVDVAAVLEGIDSRTPGDWRSVGSA